MKKALIFLNMGAPKNLDEVTLFLTNMFNDKNIITTKSNILRKMIAFLIVKTRASEAKNNYKKLGGISPLVKHTQELLKSVQKEFPEYLVLNIMRYTPEFATQGIKELQEKGIEEIILFPLYPHYSTTTVKSSLEDFFDSTKKVNFTPLVKIIEPFYKNQTYNKAIIETIKETLKSNNSKDFDIIFSAHSLPQKIIDAGDSYQVEVEEHVQILKNILINKFEFKNFHLAYQSKLGPVKWLEPSLENKLKEITNKSVIIVPLSFVLDNSETEFELNIEYKELAHELKYQNYRVAKCVNNSEIFIQAIKELTQSE